MYILPTMVIATSPNSARRKADTLALLENGSVMRHMSFSFWIFVSPAEIPHHPVACAVAIVGIAPGAQQRAERVRALMSQEAAAPLAFSGLVTSICLGRADSRSGALISSTPLLYSAVSLWRSTPSGRAIVRWSRLRENSWFR